MTAAYDRAGEIVGRLDIAAIEACADSTADDLTFLALRVEEIAARFRRCADRKRGAGDDRPLIVCNLCGRLSADLASHRCREVVQ